MALLERVSTLIRANLNDLMEKAEDPHKMIKQVILDMENQLIQVKTQVAVALADQHMLEKKRKEIEQKAAEWMQKAEFAVEKENDVLAKAALERSVNHRKMAESFEAQEQEQKAQAEILKGSLKSLTDKLAEANAKRDLLLAQHRRARGLNKAGDAQNAFGNLSGRATIDQIEDELVNSETLSRAKTELIGDDVNDKFTAMERDDQIDRLLEELKSRRRPRP
ncbi:MAG: phage shock protein PspA [Acidobacteria bacterium]|jgi:phage shock protein A|nr:phage shock protein PspA [Acidobacteriota bacterium]